jgi:hypothetical protein
MLRPLLWLTIALFWLGWLTIGAPYVVSFADSLLTLEAFTLTAFGAVFTGHYIAHERAIIRRRRSVVELYTANDVVHALRSGQPIEACITGAALHADREGWQDVTKYLHIYDGECLQDWIESLMYRGWRYRTYSKFFT